MNRLFLAGMAALPLLLVTVNTTQANPPAAGNCGGGPSRGLPCPFMGGCKGICLNWFGKMHFHGPLFNYGPYSGYYPFEPYGPWTSNFCYNPPPSACGNCGKHGCRDRSGRCGLLNHEWRLYSLLTFKNIGHRCNPIGHKCGRGPWSDCSGGGCQTAPGATVVTAPPVPVATIAQADR